MGRQVKVAFFDYFHRAKREGLIDLEAYFYAITEDIYDADGILLDSGEVTADGMCYHPQFAEIEMTRKSYSGEKVCGVCGMLLSFNYVGRNNHIMIRAAKPVKIATRSEIAARIIRK